MFKNQSGFSTIIGLIIIVFVAGIVGFLVWKEAQKKPEIKEKVKKEVIKEKKEEKKITQIIQKFLPQNFEKETAEYVEQDLNKDGKSEIIITALTSLDEEKVYVNRAFMGIITRSKKEKRYEEIGKLVFKKQAWPYTKAPQIEEIKDLDGDDQGEILLDLKTGGATMAVKGIVDVDFERKEINWMKYKDRKGKISDTLFYLADEPTAQNKLQLMDSDKDGKEEILIMDILFTPKQPEALKWPKIKKKVQNGWYICEVRPYEWDGNYFSYDRTLIPSSGKLISKCKLD